MKEKYNKPDSYCNSFVVKLNIDPKWAYIALKGVIASV